MAFLWCHIWVHSSTWGHCHHFSLHWVRAELVEVKMENTAILKDWDWVSLIRRKPEPSQLLISFSRFSSSFFCLLKFQNFSIFFSFYIFCPINDGVWHLLIKVGLFFLSCIREVEVWIPDTLAKSLSERLDCIYLPHVRVCVYTIVTMHTSDTCFSYVWLFFGCHGTVYGTTKLSKIRIFMHFWVSRYNSHL